VAGFQQNLFNFTGTVYKISESALMPTQTWWLVLVWFVIASYIKCTVCVCVVRGVVQRLVSVWMSVCLIRQHAVISFHWPQSINTLTCFWHKHTHFAGWTGSMLTQHTHTHTVHTDRHTHTHTDGQMSSERWHHTDWEEKGILWLAETVDVRDAQNSQGSD